MKFEVVCFGSGLIDIFADTDIAQRGKMIAYPVGSKIQIENLDFAVGGGGINTSTTFAKFGLKTGFFGKIGEDDFAKKILNKIHKNGVKFLGKTEGRTGYSVVLDSKEHNRTILTFKGDNDHFKTDVWKKIKTKWFYFSSLKEESFKTQLKIAKSRKAKIAFNPSMYLFGKENVKEMIKYCSVVVLNKEEADMLAKKHDKILKMGKKIEVLIVTDGKKDFYAYTSGKRYKVYPHKNIKVVERTGAGDAFASGFVAGYMKTKNVKKALQIGVANSESVVKYKGSTNKILTWNEVLKEVEKNGCRVDEKKVKA